MKKLYLLLMVVFLFSCSAEDDSYLEYEKAMLASSVEKIDDACNMVSAGNDGSITLSLAQARELPSWDEVRKLFLSLLDDGISRDGEFDPSVWDIIDAFNENPLGEFTTVYTVTEGDCSDSVNLTIVVVESLPEDSTCSLSAGADASKTISVSEADAVPSWDEVKNLYLSMLEAGVSHEGEFDPSIWNIIDSYNGIGSYSTTYTITEGDCTDSVRLTLEVVADKPSDPVCTLSAGPDGSKTLTESEADAVPSWDEVKNLYLSMLEAGVSHEGEFDPSIWNIIDSYNGPGNYTTTYTITEGECSDSVELTLHVVADQKEDPTCSLNAGPDNAKTLTYAEAAAVPSWDEVRKLYLSLLPQGVSRTGTFDPSIWSIIDEFNIKGAGTYTTTYTITEGDCTDTVQLSLIVLPKNS